MIHLAVALFAIPCFALSITAFGATSESDRGGSNGEMIEEDNMVFESDAGAANANEPTHNHPKRQIHFTTLPQQCAPERVEVSGVLQLHFKNFRGGPSLVPERANFTEFSGTGKSTGRRYVATNVHVEKKQHVHFENGVGAGSFILEFRLIGNPNPPGKPDPNPGKTFRITISYKVAYTFDNKVKGLNLGNPKGCCNPNGCIN